METNPLLDGLPYVDAINEENEQYALELVEQEMKGQTLADVAMDSPKFRTPSMRREYDRVTKGLKNSSLEFHVFSVPEDETNLLAWEDAMQKARVAYETERIRAMLLEIDKGGPGNSSSQSWKMYNELLNLNLTQLERQVQAERAAVDSINHQRRNEQEEMAKTLNMLQQQYTELMEKQRQLNGALVSMEHELQFEST